MNLIKKAKRAAAWFGLILVWPITWGCNTPSKSAADIAIQSQEIAAYCKAQYALDQGEAGALDADRKDCEARVNDWEDTGHAFVQGTGGAQ